MLPSPQFISYESPLSTSFMKNKGGGHTELLSTEFFEINYYFQIMDKTMFQHTVKHYADNIHM